MGDKKQVLRAVLFSLTLILGLGRAADAAPTEAARVDLSADQLSFAAGERVVVRVAITNPGSHPIKVLKWYTPVDDVEEPLFTVLRNGVPVPSALAPRTSSESVKSPRRVGATNRSHPGGRAGAMSVS